jgi:hypothetical protein
MAKPIMWAYQRRDIDQYYMSNEKGEIIMALGGVHSKEGLKMKGYKLGKRILKGQKYSDLTAYKLIKIK